MGLFSIFNKKQPETKYLENNPGLGTPLPEIPRNIFIEELETEENGATDEAANNATGIEIIYNFLQGDYESKGYGDALTNSDDSYKTDNIKLIKLDLQILIRKVNTYYEDIRTNIESHITTRSRSGLMDLVQDLEAQKMKIEEHIATIQQIKDEIESETGLSYRVILSYQRGFMRGLTALTQTQVFDKKL